MPILIFKASLSKEEGICFLQLSYLLVCISSSSWFDLNNITFGSSLNFISGRQSSWCLAVHSWVSFSLPCWTPCLAVGFINFSNFLEEILPQSALFPHFSLLSSLKLSRCKFLFYLALLVEILLTPRQIQKANSEVCIWCLIAIFNLQKE